MHLDLSTIWAGIICLAVLVYVVLDGFDLGVAILFPLFPRSRDRDIMMATIAPIWDGNETWLVLGGATLYAAFPVAYAALLPAAYIPIVLMLTGLIFRGVAFEIRHKARETRRWWDLAFVAGSAVATFCQGLILGSVLHGIKIVDGHFAGGPFDWLSPFGVFCGLGLLVTYATLGCSWLIMKTSGVLQRRQYPLMRRLAIAWGGAIYIVSSWTVLAQPAVANRWFASGNLPYLMPVPLLVAALLGAILLSVRYGLERLPFFLSLGVVVLGFSGLIISIFPNIVPPSLDIWAASSPAASQRFALMGTAVVLPLVMAYSTLAYWVFRGKVKEGGRAYD
jgi:cytochrome d ubiquinol oxidase subunit II